MIQASFDRAWSAQMQLKRMAAIQHVEQYGTDVYWPDKVRGKDYESRIRAAFRDDNRDHDRGYGIEH